MGIFTDEYGVRIGRVVSWGISLVIAASFAGCKGCNNIEYGNGVRTGVINKVSKKGYIWKTWEGQMALEGLVAGQAVGANLWDFSIDSQTRHGENPQELVYKLQAALNLGQRIKITYMEAGAPWATRGSTSYYIQSVEPAERIESK
ncbi:hypothetical protein HYT23_06240 [Candidatus Pacearchaeota archaeon]|nr:hypothetical protein [Candidatus Pacearchaeota archaeon]